MKIYKLIFYFIFLNHITSAQTWMWSKGFSSSGGVNSYISSVVTDKNKNVYAIGKFSENISLKNTYTGIGIFIVKLDLTGNILWEKVYLTKPNQYPTINAILDDAGNFYLFGYSDHEMTGVMDDKIEAGVFLLKYDQNGMRKRNNIIAAKDQTIYISGAGKYITCLLKNYGTIQIANRNISEQGNVILQTDTSGNFLWYASFPFSLHAKATATDPNGNVVVTGEFTDTVKFNNTILTSNGSSDAFVLKYGNTGLLQWGKAFGKSGFDQGLGITFDNQNNIFLTGDKTYNSFNISSNNFSMFIAQIDARGVLVWGKETGDAAENFPVSRNIFIDGDNNIYMNGEYKKDLYLNWIGTGISLDHTSGTDAYAGMLPYSNGFEWGLAIQGPGDQKATAMAVTEDKNIVLAGIYTDTAVIGNNRFPGKGIFVAASYKNVSPEILDFANKTAFTGLPYEITINAKDIDSDSLFASIQGLPSGFIIERFDAKSFKIKGTATETEIGSYNIQMQVTDRNTKAMINFVLSIIKNGNPIPGLELINSSLPLNGAVLRSIVPVTYQFNNPLKGNFTTYNVGTDFKIMYSNDSTNFSISFSSLEDHTFYAGFISVVDIFGNLFTKNISFTTEFTITANERNISDELISEDYFDLQGRALEKFNLERWQGIVIYKAIFRSGKTEIKKIVIQ